MEQNKSLLLRLGGRVRTLRVTRGLSQEELAERAGMSLKHLGEIERAVTEPSLTAVLGLAKGLEVRILELIPDPARTTAEPTALSHDEWQRVYDMARHLAATAHQMVQFAHRFRRGSGGTGAKDVVGDAGARRPARRPPSSRRR